MSKKLHIRLPSLKISPWMLWLGFLGLLERLVDHKPDRSDTLGAVDHH
jgi:hypothetical protein